MVPLHHGVQTLPEKLFHDLLGQSEPSGRILNIRNYEVEWTHIRLLPWEEDPKGPSFPGLPTISHKKDLQCFHLLGELHGTRLPDIAITLICPGYFISLSIFLAMS